MDKDPEASIKLNVDATKTLAEAMSKHFFTGAHINDVTNPTIEVIGRFKRAFSGFDTCR